MPKKQPANRPKATGKPRKPAPAAKTKARPTKQAPKPAKPAESTPGAYSSGYESRWQTPPVEPPDVVGRAADLIRRRIEDKAADPEARRQATRATRGGWKRVFLEALAECGIVAVAATVAGVNRTAAHAARTKDAEFSAEWKDALRTAGDAAEAEMRRRAIDGWDEPVFYEGAVCGTIRRYDSKLLLAIVQAAKPKKYRQRKEHVHRKGEPVVTQGRGKSMYAELLAGLGTGEN